MRKKKIRKFLLVLCFILILVNAICMFRKNDKLIFKAGAKIAKPIIILEKDAILKTQITEKSFPMEYHFCINNYKEEEINEVDFEYNIELKNSVQNFPVSYYLIDDETNEEIKLINGKSGNLKIKKDVKESRKFKLMLQWQELNLELADELQIKLKINVVQKQEGSYEI